MNSGISKGKSAYNFRKSTVLQDKNRCGTSDISPPRQDAHLTTSEFGGLSVSDSPSMPQQPHPNSRQGDAQQVCTTPTDSSNVILSEMRRMFAEFKTEINEKLDNVLVDLNAVKADISTVKTTMRDLEVSVADTSARLENVESDRIPSLQRRLDKMQAEFEDKLTQQELHHRKQNLLFYGIPSRPNENVYQVASKAFADILEITIEEAVKIPIVNIHRLPTKKPPIGASNVPEPPDPIIARFARMCDRDRILRAFEQPRRPRDASGNATGNPPTRERITVRTDLPPRMKRERGRLASVAFDLRKKKQLKTKIVVRGTKVILQTKNPNESTSIWKTWSE